MTEPSITGDENKTTDADESIFTASPHSNEIAMQQINKGLSGSAEGMIAGVDGANIGGSNHGDEEHDHKGKGKKGKHASHMIFHMEEDIAELYRAIDTQIISHAEHLHGIQASLAGINIEATDSIFELDSEVSSLGDQLSTQQQDLLDLEQKLEGSADQEYDQALIEQKKAEIASTESATKLHEGIKETTSNSLTKANDAFGLAQSNLADLQQQKKAAMESGDPEGLVEGLNRQISDAETSVKAAQDTINDVETNIELKDVLVDLSKNELNMKSMDCGTLDHEQEKTAMIEARTGLSDALTKALDNDGKIDADELAQIKEMSSKAGFTEQEQSKFATAIANTGVEIQTENGPLKGNAAKEYINNGFEQLEQKQTENLKASTSALDKKLTTGTEDEIAAAKTGVATIGDNQSLVTSNIKDRAGNEVQIDRSGDKNSYYYTNESGERVDYDLEKDADQILNFENNKDGDAPMMSASPQATPKSGLLDNIAKAPIAKATAPVSKFANDGVDDAAYQARFDQKEAQENIDAINEIERSVAENEISREKADALLKARQKDDDTQWSAAETLDMAVPDHNLDDADKSRNNALSAVESIAQNGGTLSKEDYDTLANAPGMSTNKLDDMMAQNKVTLGQNDIAENKASPEIFNGKKPSPTQNIQARTLDTIAPELKLVGGTKPKEEYPSFADSPEFLGNSEPNASYATPVANRTDNVASLTIDKFGKEPVTDQPKPRTDGLSPMQLEAQRTAQANINADAANSSPIPNDTGQVA